MPSFLPQVIYTFHFIIYNECFVCLGVRFNGAIVWVLFLWLFWKQNDFLTLQTLAHLEEK